MCIPTYLVGLSSNSVVDLVMSSKSSEYLGDILSLGFTDIAPHHRLSLSLRNAAKSLSGCVWMLSFSLIISSKLKIFILVEDHTLVIVMSKFVNLLRAIASCAVIRIVSEFVVEE